MNTPEAYSLAVWIYYLSPFLMALVIGFAAVFDDCRTKREEL